MVATRLRTISSKRSTPVMSASRVLNKPAARKELFGGVGLIGFAAFARKVRLHPPFHWEMIAGHTLSPNEFSKQYFQCSEP
jgi:hypothetical protein